MVGEILELDPRQIPLETDRILRALGYPTPEAASDLVCNALPGWIDRTVQSARPRMLIKIVEFATSDGLVQILDGPVFSGRLLAETMSEISVAMLLVITLGDGISEQISQLGVESTFDALGVDAVASELLEASANRFETVAGEVFRPDLPFRTLRFCPGYCDWKISELPRLLGCFDPSRIGVSLTPGGMMSPQKTIAGLIGLSNSSKDAGKSPCKHCGKKDCEHRR